jgi:UDP-N-acetyl-D-glucosamine dehydrogenase
LMVMRSPTSLDFARLRRRIESRDAVIGVVGLGYVGLPVAVAFAEEGFPVIGIEIGEERIRAIEEGRSYLRDVPAERLADVRSTGRFRVSRTSEALGEAEAEAILICLPTPLVDGTPDLSAIEEGGRAIAEVLRPGSLVVLESTSYPGTTEEILCPLLERSGLRAGKDFLLAFSPERIDPGNTLYGFGDIPKVTGGTTPEATEMAALLYGQVVTKVITVSGPKEAELAKLVENTFRHVNIALVNELAVYANELGIDIWEAIQAAASKPFGFMPFWPGPGWGGHCIPLDPAYLSWSVRRHRAHDVRFVQLAHEINSEMPRYVVERISLLLNAKDRAVRGAKILSVGVAYKGGTEDTRESPGIRVLKHHDPLVPEIEVAGRRLRSVELDAATIREQDLVVILVRQDDVDWALVQGEATAVLDCCNALGGPASNVVRL